MNYYLLLYKILHIIKKSAKNGLVVMHNADKRIFRMIWNQKLQLFRFHKDITTYIYKDA